MTERHKFFLRNLFRFEVERLGAAARRRESDAIARKLAAWPPFKRARTVGVYLSRPAEADTAAIVALCRKLGKRVLAPVVFPERRRIKFAVVDGKFSRNVYGIREPAEPRRYLPLSKIDFLIVPGRAFTPRGERLGTGGGYYDRLLAGRRPPTAALAFSAQMTARLPQATHDRPVDAVITARQTYRCSR